MTRRKLMPAALLLTLVATALALVVAGPARPSRPPRTRSRGSIRGPHNDDGWSQAHDAGRQYVQKTLGSKVQTTYKENIAIGPQLQQTVASLVNQGYKMIFGTSFGYFDKKLAAKYPDVLFEQATMTDTAKNLAEYFGAGRGHDLPLRHGGRRGDEERQARLRRPLPDPRGDPARERVRARRAGHASGREGEARLDELVVRPVRRRRRPPRASTPRRRRARAERRLARDRPVRRVGGDPVGRLRLERAERSRRSRG